jgi:hypothetical protein
MGMTRIQGAFSVHSFFLSFRSGLNCLLICKMTTIHGRGVPRCVRSLPCDFFYFDAVGRREGRSDAGAQIGKGTHRGRPARRTAG